ncbi:MAG: hypothetical protein L3J69_04460 [Desulfobacula sp.]|nr:hypothetical protein [Desulfobacula sp.]
MMVSQTQKATDSRITHDRRKFTYTAYSPERRSGINRRSQANKINGKVA